MNNDQFEALMRQGECFHAARLPAGEYVVVRVDGHGFSRFTERHFAKPFDAAFHDLMVQTAHSLVEEFGALHAYTESDEISLLLPPDWSAFGRSHEKIVSLTAAHASAVFSRASGHIARFDSRVWLGRSPNAVADYFRWRQSDATRCALNGWCYWTLRQRGSSYRAATKELESQPATFKRDLLLQHGIDFDALPAWQQRGVGLEWETYEKRGLNPVTGMEETATRRRISVQRELPVGAEYGGYICGLLQGAEADDSRSGNDKAPHHSEERGI